MKELKIKDKGYEIEIVSVQEVNGLLRVKTRTPFGEDNLGLNVESKYLDLDGKPKFLKQIRRLLEKKYGRWENNESTAKEKEVFTQYKGVYDIGDL